VEWRPTHGLLGAGAGGKTVARAARMEASAAPRADAEVGAADASNDGGQVRGIEGGQGRVRSSIPSTRRPGSLPPPLAQPPPSLAPLLQSDPALIWRHKDLDWLRYAG
jgi:hypothetical protein